MLLAGDVFTGLRAAIAFLPVTAVALAAGLVIAGRRFAHPRKVATLVVVTGVVSVGVLWGATEAIYPGAFAGVFSNQSSQVLNAADIPKEPQVGAGACSAVAAAAARGPLHRAARHRAAARPRHADQAGRPDIDRGRREGLRRRARLRRRGHPRRRALATHIPKAQTTGTIWLGRVLGDTGWIGIAAFFGLMAWLRAPGHCASSGARPAPGTARSATPCSASSG